MSIYSVNRTGSMALSQVNVSESYMSRDFGTILYESQVNDMAFFEAILACDFNEINGLREGTLLENEVKDLNKSSARVLIDKLCAKLKAFWQKIKDAFKAAMDKIAAFTVRDGKAFVRDFNRTVEKRIGNIKNWKGSVQTKIYDKSKIGDFDTNMMQTMFSYYVDTEDDSNAIVTTELGRTIGGKKVDSVANYTKEALTIAFKDDHMNAAKVNDYTAAMSNAKDAIANLKKEQREAESTVNMAIKFVRDEVESKSNVGRINTIVSAFEKVIVAMCKTKITAIKMDVKNRRVALSKALSEINNSSKPVKEAAVLDAMLEVDMAMDSIEALPSDTQAEVDELIDSVEI